MRKNQSKIMVVLTWKISLMDHFDDHKTFEPLTSKPYLVGDAHHVFVFLITTFGLPSLRLDLSRRRDCF